MQTMVIYLLPLQENIKQICFTHQADGGAAFASTDQIDLLHDYKVYLKPIAIVSFFSQDNDSNTPPQEHTSIDEGIPKLIKYHGEIIPMWMLYIPNSTSTVISSKRTIKDMWRFNKSNRIVSWNQNGRHQFNLQWKDKDGRMRMSSLQMEERNGLYYIINATLLAPVKPYVQTMQIIEPIKEANSSDKRETPSHPEQLANVQPAAQFQVETTSNNSPRLRCLEKRVQLGLQKEESVMR